MTPEEKAAKVQAELDHGPNVKTFPGRKAGSGAAPDDPPAPEPSTWRDRLTLCRASSLEGKLVKSREWVVDQWIPRHHLTGVYGPGSVGKTTLLTQLCCAASVENGSWLGMPVRKSKPFAFFAEDDDDEIERKIYDTSVLYGHRRAEYVDFAYMGRFAHDNLLFVRSKNGIATTALYADLCQMVADEHRDLLLFDGIPDIYALSLNDQGEVTWALGKMLAMAKPTRATVMLLGHPNKAGTSEFTGCGAWENKPRARLYLGPAKQKAGDEGEEVALNDPRRQLRRSKANLSAKDALDVIWEQGTFRLEHPGFATYGDQLDREMRKGQAGQAFLDALAKLTEQQISLSDRTRAGNFGPRLIKDAGLANGFTVKELEAGMHAMLNEHRIRANMPLPWRDAARHSVVGLALCAPVP